MKNLIFVLLFFHIFSCKENKNQHKNETNNITILLPFESSNFENFTNFSLYDSLGVKCIPILDTITKGGGTIDYENLPNGTYSYRINTIFNETISKQLKIDSSRNIYFYDECYNVKDVINYESLIAAKQIKIFIETFNQSDTSDIDELNFEKNNNKYLFSNSGSENIKGSKALRLDSSKFINALTEFEVTLIGLREMGITNKNHNFRQKNSVYIKCDNQFLVIYNIKTENLIKAIKNFKKALLNN